jgi:hypothetical protein
MNKDFAMQKLVTDPIWALEESGRLTNEELFKLLTVMNTVVKTRLSRRINMEFYVVQKAICSYFKRNPFIIDGKLIKMKSVFLSRDPSMRITTNMSFKFGEIYRGVRYTDQDPNWTHIIYSGYKLSITNFIDYTAGSKNKLYAVKLSPPLHHVLKLPTDRGDPKSDEEYIDEASLVFNNARTHNIPEFCTKLDRAQEYYCHRESHDSIHGDLLQAFMGYFIRGGRTVEIMDLISHIFHQYHLYPIGKTRSATMAFLIIGRHRLLAEYIKMPYDVVQLIARKVWNTRYEVDSWRVINKETYDPISCTQYEDHSYNLREGNMEPYVRDHKVLYDEKLMYRADTFLNVP